MKENQMQGNVARMGK